MSNTNALAPSRTHGSDRFYCPPPVRRNQKLQQIQRPFNSDTRVDSVEPDLRTDSHDSALLRPNSVASSSPPITNSYTNFDRILESLTPFVPAQISSEPGVKGHRAPQSNSDPWFFLEDLWESFTESSAYGVEVPLIINGSESIQQYYIPYLSAIQLYAEESYEAEVSSSSGQLVYEYFEGALPHLRPPFHNKISILASEFPNLKKYGSNDLLPSSWFSVSWYPIYRIPVGSTLKSLDASFLTFHSLSTNSRKINRSVLVVAGWFNLLIYLFPFLDLLLISIEAQFCLLMEPLNWFKRTLYCWLLLIGYRVYRSNILITSTLLAVVHNGDD
ncbi:PREDICTED: uncharacterized protein LOC109335199 isoform X2 [Lupinus angustifolius]|uniref:uncharacterized protein LOC109335199 isoform X2 n=1 Tax=Lupinus angustifolius TaxID=3871 RepID=UPI00092E200F|nr:PREDICTED: uncharacterized protein LOC109335199 isoform X2 [Lupinus angustifolius]